MLDMFRGLVDIEALRVQQDPNATVWVKHRVAP